MMFCKLKKIIILFIAFLSFYFCQTTYAESEESNTENKNGFFAMISNAIKEVWHSDIYDLYVPVNTWHNRFMYDKEKTDKYNEKPWGIGIGKSRLDNKRNLHQLYIMEFQDSHDRVEVILGYNYQWKWYLDKRQDFSVGLGGTIGATFRADFSTPLVLPILSLNYKFLSVETTYIPGTYNSLNVLFTWLRFSFKI